MNKRAHELHQDPISAASAGLVALGIERARRVDVLDVLGHLIDQADASGQVVLDRALFAREEALGVDKCLDAYALLEQLDVVARTDRGWRIAEFAAHHGPAGETMASLAILRKHLISVGSDAQEFETSEARTPELVPIAAISPLRRIRRAVPIAAGVAAVAVGANYFVPQAAVTGRNAAVRSDAPTTVVRSASPDSTAKVIGAAPATPSTAAATATTTGTPTSVDSPTPAIACLVPQVVAAVTSVDIVRLPLSGELGGVWAAVVKGTATLTNAESAVLLPALNVVAHRADGDTDAVQATLASPLLRPSTPAEFSAVVALGAAKPTEAVTATATAVGLPGC